MNFLEVMSFGDQGWATDMLLAALMTCAISVCGFLCGSVIGCLGCWAKLSRSYLLRWLADVYTTVLRGVPDLLVIYLFYFGSSMVLTQLAQSLGLKGFVGLPGFFVGVVAISVISGAYQLEVLRGAVNSVAIGSIEAGRSIGLSNFKLFSLIIAPQALRLALTERLPHFLDYPTNYVRQTGEGTVQLG